MKIINSCSPPLNSFHFPPIFSSLCSSSPFSPPCSFAYILHSQCHIAHINTTHTYTVITCTNCTLLCVIIGLSVWGEGCGKWVKATKTVHVSHAKRGGHKVWTRCGWNKTLNVFWNMLFCVVAKCTASLQFPLTWSLMLQLINKSIL